MGKKRIGSLITILIISVIAIAVIYKQFITEDKPKVVVVLKNLNLQYWELVKAGADKGFDDFGIDGKVMAPKREAHEEQRDILLKVLKEHPDVLIVSPIDTVALTPVLDEFEKQGIPVMFIHTDDYWKHKTSYVGTNNLELGKKAGILLGAELQPGNQVALLGRDAELDETRLRGARSSLEAIGIEIVAQIGGLSIVNPDEVERRMEGILEKYPNLNGVIASTDYISLPALKVIQKHDLEIPVTGADGITDMLKLIDQGTMSSAVVQNPYDMGYLSTQTALKVANGEKVNKHVDSGVDIITKDNAGDRIEFYTKLLE